MRVRLDVAPLPAGLGVAIVMGEREVVLQVRADLSIADACYALESALGDFLTQQWLYIGDVAGEGQSDR